MKRLTFIAGCAAIAGLTACTHTAAPSAAGSSGTAGSSGAVARPSPTSTHTVSAAACKQQYDAWKQGPGEGVVSSLTAIDSAAATGTSELKAELKKSMPVLARAARYPVPSCADPNGYWIAVMMHMNAAAASTGSASTLTVAMKGVPSITHKLVAELKQADASTA